MTTEQEKYWQGKAGDDYQTRNAGSRVGSVDSNHFMFGKILAKMPTLPHSIIEFGAGIGNNLEALRCLLPDAAICAVEINIAAADQIHAGAVRHESIFDYPADRLNPYELAFTKGLLIHIAPQDLPRAYQTLHAASSRYVLMCEYYCPKRRMIPYRNEDNRLWAADFAGEFMDAYPDMHLTSYGFVYHRDRDPQDDVSWFLMEKAQ